MHSPLTRHWNLTPTGKNSQILIFLPVFLPYLSCTASDPNKFSVTHSHTIPPNTQHSTKISAKSDNRGLSNELTRGKFSKWPEVNEYLVIYGPVWSPQVYFVHLVTYSQVWLLQVHLATYGQVRSPQVNLITYSQVRSPQVHLVTYGHPKSIWSHKLR